MIDFLLKDPEERPRAGAMVQCNFGMLNKVIVVLLRAIVACRMGSHFGFSNAEQS